MKAGHRRLLRRAGDAAGRYAGQATLPFVLGYDLVGVVRAVGPQVDEVPWSCWPQIEQITQKLRRRLG
jgi:NADPH:quinone reductase-like Zn-dependent oxidoreductase